MFFPDTLKYRPFQSFASAFSKAKIKNKIFKFEEQRSSLTLENIDQVLSTKIIVDGCEINDNDVKCDYLHLAKGMEMYIELKDSRQKKLQ